MIYLNGNPASNKIIFIIDTYNPIKMSQPELEDQNQFAVKQEQIKVDQENNDNNDGGKHQNIFDHKEEEEGNASLKENHNKGVMDEIEEKENEETEGIEKKASLEDQQRREQDEEGSKQALKKEELEVQEGLTKGQKEVSIVKQGQAKENGVSQTQEKENINEESWHKPLQSNANNEQEQEKKILLQSSRKEQKNKDNEMDQQNMNQFQIQQDEISKIFIKPEEDDSPFQWGEEQKSVYLHEPDYSELYLNKNIKHSEEILKKGDIYSKESKRPHTETKKDGIDIWKDLREEMKKKEDYSNAEDIFRHKRGKKKKNSNASQKRSQSEKKLPDNRKQFEKKPKISLLKKSNSAQIHVHQQNNNRSSAEGEEEMLKNIDDIKKQIAMKIRNWSKQQKQIEERRILFIQKQNRDNEEKARLQRIEKKNLVEKEKEERVKRVLERLEKRQKLRRKVSSNSEKSPKLQKSQGNIKNHQSIILKVNKSDKNIHLKLKGHSSQLPHKKSLENLEKIINGQQSRISQNKQFSVILNKDTTNYEKEKIKAERRKVFNEKTQKIPVNVNGEKKLKMLINIDKSMNQLKYQIMGRKGFSDEEIYHQTKQFQLPENPRNLGNQYLRELREKNRRADLMGSLNNIHDFDTHERDWKPAQAKEGKNRNSILYSNNIHHQNIAQSKIVHHNSARSSNYSKALSPPKAKPSINPQIERIASKLALHDEDDFLMKLQRSGGQP